MPPTLIDTSVLARLLERDSPKGRAARCLLEEPRFESAELSLCSQALTEFWVVATRPRESNGYGLAPADADACITDFLDSFGFLPDPPDLFDRWRNLVVSYGVRGKVAHDARFVALIQAYGARRVLTFNARDFQRYDGIEVIVPQ
ncbi:MAG: PIN domain-containing protein [Phycisphaerales bacterium]|nr:PIN domain-containing protein [Phycisphaerales bacterium]